MYTHKEEPAFFEDTEIRYHASSKKTSNTLTESQLYEIFSINDTCNGTKTYYKQILCEKNSVQCNVATLKHTTNLFQRICVKKHVKCMVVVYMAY